MFSDIITIFPADSDFIRPYTFDCYEKDNKVYLTNFNLIRYRDSDPVVTEPSFEVLSRIAFISKELGSTNIELYAMVGEVEIGEDNERILNLQDLKGQCKTAYNQNDVCNHAFDGLLWPLDFSSTSLFITINYDKYRIPFCPVCGRCLSVEDRVKVEAVNEYRSVQEFVSSVVYRLHNVNDIYQELGKPDIDLGSFDPYFLPCRSGDIKVVHSLWYTTLFEDLLTNIKVFENGIITSQFTLNEIFYRNSKNS